jgi:small-conductance mechanosensitive channel
VLVAFAFPADLLSGSTVSGWDVALAVIVLLVSWLVAHLAKRGVRHLAARLEGVSDNMKSVVGRIAWWAALLLGVGIALSILGAPINPLLTAAVIVSVVAILALRGVADNFAAGVVIQTRGPFHVGDEIDSLGHVGVVRELNSRSVVIETDDGRTVHLPNAKVLESPIVNHSAAGARRSQVEVRVGRSTSTAELLTTITEAAAAVEGVLADPSPGASVVSADATLVTAQIRFWHRPPDTSTVVTAVVAAVLAGHHDATVSVGPA